jgi:hypothetical protein
MRKLLLLSLLAAGLYACTNTADTGEKEVASEPPAEQSTLDWKEEAFPQYLRALESQDSTFTLDSFAVQEAAPSEAGTQASPLDPERLVPFESLFIYNADSTRAIDLFSYNYVPTARDGQRYMAAGEPDTEVALINYKDKTRTRLLFLGPSYAALDARWLSNDQVAIAGAELVGDNKIKPIIWKLTLPSHQVETEFYTDTVHADIPAIREQRFTSVRFQ